QDNRPNILLIVADDLGYSDLGSYGGEFNTPSLDKLADEGIRYTNFYVSPACATTRSMLLTGTDNHVAGLGSFENFIPPDAQGKPGYEGWMNHRVVTVASCSPVLPTTSATGGQTSGIGQRHRIPRTGNSLTSFPRIFIPQKIIRTR
ncbi:MAG: sulfatase-like hydrolase/transferase, partial [Deltaproteobacteria bacterium]|nr:sulfatase-like hydrolase/transferase [Deltaproteobacteria bacterium]